jgi:hypothetical protein
MLYGFDVDTHYTRMLHKMSKYTEHSAPEVYIFHNIAFGARYNGLLSRNEKIGLKWSDDYSSGFAHRRDFVSWVRIYANR